MSVPAPTFPPLSPTYQSSQIWTPQNLQRLTIDQSRYHRYVSRTLNEHPPHLTALHRRVQHYGDNYFHLHRDIPIHQDYSLTCLHLSDLRPWDQLVDRPCKDNRVLQKELSLPFPKEHPYTSHMSRFSVFPDTHSPHTLTTDTTAQSHTHRDFGTQTTAMDLRPLTSYYVTHKASEMGLRREQHHLFAGHHVTTSVDHVTTGRRGQVWDIPRSQHRQRSQSYPAPMFQYTPLQQAPSTISHNTQEALRTIHSLTAGTTSYRDHFRLPPSPWVPIDATTRQMSTTGDQFLDNSRPLYSSYSHSRPYTAEIRAKYRGKCVMEEHGEEWEWEQEEEVKDEGSKIVMKDAATQTDEVDEYLTAPRLWPQGDHHVLMDSATLPETTTHDRVTTTLRPKSTTVVVPRTLVSAAGTATRPGGMGCGIEVQHRHQRSFSVDGSTFLPRSLSSARRFKELYGFSHSDVLKRFHLQYPEQAPDLRQYGIQKGKRHTIHGYNSYHFH